MSVLFTNPVKLAAGWMASHHMTADITMEPMFVGSAIEPKTIQDQYRRSNPPPITYAAKFTLPRRRIIKNYVLMTHFKESKEKTHYFIIDNAVVVCLKTHAMEDVRSRSINHSNAGVIHVVTDSQTGKEVEIDPNFRKLRLEFFFWVVRYWLYWAGSCFSLLATSYSLVKRLEGKGGYAETALRIVGVAVYAITALACWRMIQMALWVIKWECSAEHIGGWVGRMRYLAYTYPALVSKHPEMQKFLLKEELKYLSGKKLKAASI